jgi:hypothetical protein
MSSPIQIQRKPKRPVLFLRIFGIIPVRQDEQAASSFKADLGQVALRVLYSLHLKCFIWKPQHSSGATS